MDFLFGIIIIVSLHKFYHMTELAKLAHFE